MNSPRNGAESEALVFSDIIAVENYLTDIHERMEIQRLEAWRRLALAGQMSILRETQRNILAFEGPKGSEMIAARLLEAKEKGTTIDREAMDLGLALEASEKSSMERANAEFDEAINKIMAQIAADPILSFDQKRELAFEINFRNRNIDETSIRADQKYELQREALLDLILSSNDPEQLLNELWAKGEFNSIFGTEGAKFNRLKKLDKNFLGFKRWAIEKGLFDLLMELITTHDFPMMVLENLWQSGEFNSIFGTEDEALRRAKKIDKSFSDFRPWLKTIGFSELVDKLEVKEDSIKPGKDLKVARK